MSSDNSGFMTTMDNNTDGSRGSKVSEASSEVKVSVKGLKVSEASSEVKVSVKGLKDTWQKWSTEHQQYQKNNPFSNEDGRRTEAEVPQRGHQDYGRPPPDSLTERRGRDAHTHVSREVQELCHVIRSIGRESEDGGEGVVVEFGRLFEHYVKISNKLVGVLLRARKQKLLEFEGEMLWQGKDDHVLITLLQ